ncbi:hypothetical protein B0H13DRAFT_2097163 [Mycena leptocephala]|nr:hypothetical protein B0H13DRAFT_2097163 [Mycena leptocephala]
MARKIEWTALPLFVHSCICASSIACPSSSVPPVARAALRKTVSPSALAPVQPLANRRDGMLRALGASTQRKDGQWRAGAERGAHVWLTQRPRHAVFSYSARRNRSKKSTPLLCARSRWERAAHGSSLVRRAGGADVVRARASPARLGAPPRIVRPRLPDSTRLAEALARSSTSRIVGESANTQAVCVSLPRDKDLIGSVPQVLPALVCSCTRASSITTSAFASKCARPSSQSLGVATPRAAAPPLRGGREGQAGLSAASHHMMSCLALAWAWALAGGVLEAGEGGRGEDRAGAEVYGRKGGWVEARDIARRTEDGARGEHGLFYRLI